MSDTNAQEPTMEEILASIRRIISEDDAPAAAAPAAAEPEPEPEPEAAVHTPEPAPADDVLELTQRIQPPPAAEPAEPEPMAFAPEPAPAKPSQTLGDLDVFPSEPEPEPEPAPPPPRAFSAPAPVESDEPLLSARAAESAASMFGSLAQSLAMPAPGRTLEDLVRELMRPLLKEWLDQNLGKIVERTVQAEVERISRGGRSF